jgi:hypothetical protein
MAPRLRIGVLAVVTACAACGGAPEGARQERRDAPSTAASASGASPASAAPTQTPPLAATCIRTGSTQAEVRQVMGAPDSVVFGAWVYGRSQILFGYGTVQDYANVGGNLIICR